MVLIIFKESFLPYSQDYGHLEVFVQSSSFKNQRGVGQRQTTKISGVDNISSFFLKLTLPLVGNSLALLFNASIETSTFPDSWKIATVTSICNDGDKADKSNCRYISATS